MWHQEVALVFREMDVGLYCFMMPHSAHILFTLGRVLAAKALFPPPPPRVTPPCPFPLFPSPSFFLPQLS